MNDSALGEERRAEIAGRWQRCREVMRDLRAAGYLRVDLEPYAKPWKVAIENNPEAWSLAKTWRRADGNVILLGWNGVGKSALCRRLLFGDLWASQNPGEWSIADISGTAFMQRFCGFEATARFDRLAGCGVLYIDDLDKAEWTPRALSLLLELVDLRVENGRPILMTANMPERNIKKMFADARPENGATAIALYDRLMQRGQTHWMEGRNLRELSAKEAAGHE